MSVPKVNLPVLDNYEGKFEIWMRNISAAVTPIEEDKDRVAAVLGVIRGDAALRWYSLGPVPEELASISFIDLLAALRGCFKEFVSPDYALTYISAIKMQDNNLRAYVKAFTEARAVLGPKCDLDENIFMQAFVAGLASHPAFQNTVRMALRTEKFKLLGPLVQAAEEQAGMMGPPVVPKPAPTPAQETVASVASVGAYGAGRGGGGGRGRGFGAGRGRGAQSGGGVRVEKRVCFKCGIAGHIAVNCPVKNDAYLLPTSIHVAVRGVSAGPNQELLGSLAGSQARLLIDSGSQLNLMSEAYAHRLRLPLSQAGQPTMLEYADGRRGLVRTQCTPGLLSIGRDGFTTELGPTLVTRLSPGIDVILGQTFLGAVNPTIDWVSGRVSACAPGAAPGSGEKILREPRHTTHTGATPQDAARNEPAHARPAVTQPATTGVPHVDTLHADVPTQPTTVGSAGVATPAHAAPSASVGSIRFDVVSAKSFERTLKKPGTIATTAAVVWGDKLVADVQGVNAVSTSASAAASGCSPDIRQLIEEYADIMEPDGKLPPLRPGMQHKINVVLPDGVEPPAHRPYRLSWEENAALKQILDKMLASGEITTSTSPYAAPVLLVKKKSGEWRMCCDYRALNKLTVREHFPMPHITDLLNQLRGSTVFTKVDLKSGFFQIRVEEGDEEKTSFITQHGQFQYRVMAMGLTNAPSTFQRVMSRVLKPYVGDFVALYLDDLLIHSKDMQEHVRHLRLVFAALRKYQLFLNVKKCEFARPEVVFLGHLVGHDRVSVEEAKVAAVRDWAMPTTRRELQRFLGTVNFYRSFVPDFSGLAAPLTDLLRVDEDGALTRGRLVVSAVHRTAFNALKSKLCSAPVLVLPDPTKPFVLTTDASDVAVSGVLEQDQGKGLQPVAYASMKLTGAERNYAVRDKELLAQLSCMEHFRVYLSGRRFTLRTDHQSLASFDKQELASGRLARWAQRMASFEYDVVYIKGTDNIADGLSRVGTTTTSATTRPEMEAVHRAAPVLAAPASSTSVSLSVHWPTEAAVELEALKADSYFGPIIRVLQKDASYVASASVLRRSRMFSLRDDGALFFVEPGGEGMVAGGRRRCASVLSRPTLLSEVHDTGVGGHQGQFKMYATLRSVAFWPNMVAAVARHCRTCDGCQRHKAMSRPLRGVYEPLPVPPRPWHSIALDFVDLPMSTLGHDCALVLSDHFSGQVHIAPTVRTATAETAAELVLQYVVRAHGLPSVLTSDRDPRFTSAVWTELWRRMGSKLRMSTAHRPQSDGKSERSIRSVQTVLRQYCNSVASDWDAVHVLALTELALNSAVQASTGKSALEIVQGFQPVVPTTLASGLPQPSAEERARDVQAGATAKKLEETWRQVHDALRDSHEATTSSEEQRRPTASTATPKVGDEVLLHTRNYPQLRVSKLHAPYVGPFKVTATPSTATATLELPPSMKIHPTINIDQLKPYVRREPEQPPGPVAGTEGRGQQPMFAVDKLLDRRMRRGRREYLVRWRGYGQEHDSWEPEGNVKHLHILIADLLKTLPTTRTSPRGKGG